jgi:hypothetical protein
MIVFLLLAFLYYLLQSALTAERYWPEVGFKPFSPNTFVHRVEVNFKEWEPPSNK